MFEYKLLFFFKEDNKNQKTRTCDTHMHKKKNKGRQKKYLKLVKWLHVNKSESSAGKKRTKHICTKKLNDLKVFMKDGRKFISVIKIQLHFKTLGTDNKLKIDFIHFFLFLKSLIILALDNNILGSKSVVLHKLMDM